MEGIGILGCWEMKCLFCKKQLVLEEESTGGTRTRELSSQYRVLLGLPESHTGETIGRLGSRKSRNVFSFLPQLCVHGYLLSSAALSNGDKGMIRPVHLVRRAWHCAIKALLSRHTPMKRPQLPQRTMTYRKAGHKQQVYFWRQIISWVFRHCQRKPKG